MTFWVSGWRTLPASLERVVSQGSSGRLRGEEVEEEEGRRRGRTRAEEEGEEGEEEVE